MFPRAQILRSTATWVSAAILGLLPIAVALDYGGVLRWTHYVIALAVLVATAFALTSLTERGGPNGWHQHRLLIPVLLWTAFAWFQTVPLPASAVAMLSPGSAQAYTDWIAPYLEPQQRPQSFPISVAPFDSWHVFAMLMVLMGLTWTAAQVFSSRSRIGWLLCLISIGATVQALIGLWRLVFPDSLAWSGMPETVGNTFGSFVNRNNAALFLNFGLAASLGLLSWRLTAMTGLEVDDPSFEFNDLFSLINDRESAVGVAGAAVCLTGLLVCGSRGGIVSALVGGLLAFGWVRQRRGFISFPVVGAVIAIAIACMVVPFNLDLTSLQRFELSADADSSTILRDGRWKHWRDGMEAGIAHLPAGSGLSTYAYSHLPYKQTGPFAWYHHADNLWLELLVEQGVVGIGLALLVVFFLVQSLNQLGLSTDPLDQGLRTTGWYALGVILVSQAFDFGLIIPANLLVAVTLMAAIFARDAAIRVPLSSEPRKVPLRARRHDVAAYSGAAISVAALLLSLPILRHDAEVESAVRSVQARFEVIKTDPTKLQQAAEELNDSAGPNMPPEVSTLLSEIDYRIARVTEVLEAQPETDEEISEIYEKTGAVARRLRWRQEPAEKVVQLVSNSTLAKDSTQFYRRSLETAGQTLLALPLDSVSRTKYVYLDFIHRDPELTRLSLQQLRQIYRNNPPMLMRLGVFAADSGETAAAVEMWRSAILQAPAFTGQTIEQAKQRGDFRFTDVVPHEAKNLRAAARVLLAKGIEDDGFLTEALAGIACESCNLLSEQAECEQLAGDIQFKLGRFDDAFASYQSAIEKTPADADLRLKLIRLLREEGRKQEALGEARLGRKLFPQDGRFDATIKLMAEIDLEEIEQAQSSGAAVSP